MSRIRIVIEVYGGVAQNVYVAHEAPEMVVEAVIVDWDHEFYEAHDDCLVHAAGLDGEPTLACVSAATLKPWRLLPAAGIQDVLDRAGLADFGSPSAAEPRAPAHPKLAPHGFDRRRPGRAT
jgi:hypothetical protein